MSNLDVNYYHSSFGRTIREIAESEADPVRRRKLFILASELEIMFNSQANNTQIALGGAEISWHARIDELLIEISDIKNGNTSTHKVVESISSELQELSDVIKNQGASVVQLRIDLQTTSETVSSLVTDLSDVKRSIKKYNREQARLFEEFSESEQVSDSLRNQVDEISEHVKFILRDLAGRLSESSIQSLVRRISEMESYIQEMRRNDIRTNTATAGLERNTSSPDQRSS